MQTKKQPTPGRRVGHKQKHFRHPHHNTEKRKIKHWSRRPRQRQRDAALLAFFGLGFKQTCGTFYSLKKIDAPKVDTEKHGYVAQGREVVNGR